MTRDSQSKSDALIEPSKTAAADTPASKIEQSSNGKWLFSFLALICFASLAILLFVSGDVGGQAYEQKDLMLTQQTQAQVLPVNIQTSYQRKRIIYGRLESKKRADIGFDIAGAMQSVAVEEGAYVSAGQVLASLDIERLLARENELNAQLNRVKSELRLAEISAKRVDDLVERKLEPQQNLDEAQANLESAEALVKEVEATLVSLTLEKEKSILKAPFAGQVVSQLVDQGTVLTAGQPVFTLITDEALEARFGLPEDIAFGITQGQVMPIKIGSVDAQQTLEGKVISIAKQRNLATRTIDTVFSLNHNSSTLDGSVNQSSVGQLRSVVEGDLVSIQVGFDVEKKGAWLPVSALSNGVRGLWSVLVYNASSQQLEVRTVAVEQLEQSRVFVSGAIKEGALVLVNGTHRFVPGQTLEQVEQVTMSASLQAHELSTQSLVVDGAN